ncbi:polymeric immunoglobulin receptor-like [Centroberyx affinis]|uniref:polymeric immunoglobulin receptor-like n=1 Tax=Centroberyx affinis TaxID=166261 RepID=UPI003A5C2F47
MAFPYIPLLILCGLIGIHSITTVSKVSVKAGGSISIPCLYDARYINHVKCLCHGNDWSSCTYVVKTNQPSLSGKFSISDDTKQRIFTVTINDLVVQDTSYYWCAVEIEILPDVKKKISLDVSADKPTLYVDQQEITGFEGGNVTVKCHYTGSSGLMKWCGLDGGVAWTCVKSGNINGARVTIDASVPNVSIVTMSELKIKSSGWYLCRKGNLQMPVHVTVHKQTSTTTTTVSPTATIMSPTTTTLSPTATISSTTTMLSHLLLSPQTPLQLEQVETTCQANTREKAKTEASASTGQDQTPEDSVTYSPIEIKNRTSQKVTTEMVYIPG